LGAVNLFGQAWLSPKGEGTLSLSYQYILVRNHYFSTGVPEDVGHVFSHAMTMDVDYSLTDKLALRVAIPFVAAKYTGQKPHQLPADDGTYHSTFQDFAIDLRYQVTKRRIVLAPFFRAVIPSNGYTYFAHSAVGRDLREYQTGMNFGRRLNPVLPKAYLQARYSYAFVERIVGIAPNRSAVEAQLGYFVSRRLSVMGQGQWMHTHAGVDHLFGVYHGGLPDDLYPHHDQIGKASLLDLGGGAAYSVNRALVVFLSLGHSMEGRNTHAHAAVLTVGFSRSFGGLFEGKSALARTNEQPELQRAVVCTCVKTK
jgi:hypothetical protein